MKDMIDRVDFETLQDHGRGFPSVALTTLPVVLGIGVFLCVVSLVYFYFFN